jgi:hypothetical protein
MVDLGACFMSRHRAETMTPLRVIVFVLVSRACRLVWASPMLETFVHPRSNLGDGVWRVRGLDIRAHSLRNGDSDIVGLELTQDVRHLHSRHSPSPLQAGLSIKA